MSEVVEKEHHTFGGSSAKYWSSCYGWAAEMAHLPPDVAGQPALVGTALHTGILERKVRAEIKHLKNGAPVNVKYDDIPDWPAHGSEMADEFWNYFFKEVLEEIVTGKTIYIESKVMFDKDLDAGGTTDAAVLYRNDKNQVVLDLGDIKTGRIRVEPDEEQLLFYSAGVNRAAQARGISIEVFKTFVYQPTHNVPFTRAKFTKKQVESADKKYVKAIFESKKDKPKYKVGDYCTYCRAQATCKAYNKHISKEMDLAVIQTKGFPAVETLSDDQLVGLWKISEPAEKYFSAVKRHILDRFALDKPVPGVKVVSGVSKRKWADEDVAITVLRGAGVEPTVPKIIGIIEAEKQLKLAGKVKKDVDAIMYTLTEKPQGKPLVVSEDDKREAIDIKPVNLLEGIEENGLDWNELRGSEAI